MLIETQEMVIARKHWHILGIKQETLGFMVAFDSIIKLVNIKLWFMV
jgi:hypothetical protein